MILASMRRVLLSFFFSKFRSHLLYLLCYSLCSDVSRSPELSAMAEGIYLMCMKPLGAWYAENDVEGMENIGDISKVGRAFANAIALCDRCTFGSGENDNEMEAVDSDDDEDCVESNLQAEREPLFFLLPALTKILHSTSDPTAAKVAKELFPRQTEFAIIDVFLRFSCR